MAQVIIDGQTLEIGDKERLNGIEVARRAGIEIPHYCWHPGLTVVASCRMCLVESGTRNAQTGEISMQPRLVPACQTPAKDGTVFVTNSDKVKHSRAFVEEALLLDHPVDCPICDKAGECHLQDYHFEHGQKERRADIRPFSSRRREMGETVTLFVDRCVMCSRCVRFCREISGTGELMITHRGSHEEIDVLDGFPLNNKLSGNVVDLCPVGALGDKDFLYQQRVWFLKSHAGVCTGCSTGCSISLEENQDRLWRLKPRENPHVNHWWMCDEGRHGFHYVHREDRLAGPRRRTADGNGYENTEWSRVCADLPGTLTAAGRLAGVFSPHLTVEEAYLLANFLRSIDPRAMLAMGPVPRVGQDEQFRNGFTIRAEKCPNRRGVEAVLWHFTGECLGWDQLLDRLDPPPSATPSSGADGIRGIWISAAYPEPWIDELGAGRLAHIETIIVQDLFDSPLWQRATYQLPTATFAERDGSYVNHADRLQTATWAVRPPVGVWSQGQLLWRLLNRHGMYDARQVLHEVAREITYFSAADAEISAHGLDLKLNQLAATS